MSHIRTKWANHAEPRQPYDPNVIYYSYLCSICGEIMHHLKGAPTCRTHGPVEYVKVVMGEEAAGKAKILEQRYQDALAEIDRIYGNPPMPVGDMDDLAEIFMNAEESEK